MTSALAMVNVWKKLQEEVQKMVTEFGTSGSSNRPTNTLTFPFKLMFCSSVQAAAFRNTMAYTQGTGPRMTDAAAVNRGGELELSEMAERGWHFMAHFVFRVFRIFPGDHHHHHHQHHQHGSSSSVPQNQQQQSSHGGGGGGAGSRTTSPSSHLNNISNIQVAGSYPSGGGADAQSVSRTHASSTIAKNNNNTSSNIPMNSNNTSLPAAGVIPISESQMSFPYQYHGDNDDWNSSESENGNNDDDRSRQTSSVSGFPVYESNGFFAGGGGGGATLSSMQSMNDALGFTDNNMYNKSHRRTKSGDFSSFEMKNIQNSKHNSGSGLSPTNNRNANTVDQNNNNNNQQQQQQPQQHHHHHHHHHHGRPQYEIEVMASSGVPLAGSWIEKSAAGIMRDSNSVIGPLVRVAVFSSQDLDEFVREVERQAELAKEAFGLNNNNNSTTNNNNNPATSNGNNIASATTDGIIIMGGSTNNVNPSK
jgi:hypothetical protein